MLSLIFLVRTPPIGAGILISIADGFSAGEYAAKCGSGGSLIVGLFSILCFV